MCANEIDCPLQCGKGSRTSQPNDGRPLYPMPEPHVCDEATTHVRTHIAGACADCKEIYIPHGSSGCPHTVQNCAATCFHGSAQIALIQLIRAFLAIHSTLQIKMTIVDIAIQEDLPKAIALVTRSMKALLLRESNRRVRCSDTEYPRMVHWSPTDSCEKLVFPFGGGVLSSALS